MLFLFCYIPSSFEVKLLLAGESPSGKAGAFEAPIRRFESFLPNHLDFSQCLFARSPRIRIRFLVFTGEPLFAGEARNVLIHRYVPYTQMPL